VTLAPIDGVDVVAYAATHSISTTKTFVRTESGSIPISLVELI
jgi:hypothetical protein